MPGVQAHLEGKLTTCGVRATNLTHFLSRGQSQLCLTSADPFIHNQFDFTRSLYKWVWNLWVMLGSQVAALILGCQTLWTTFHQPGLSYLFKWDSSGFSDTFPMKAVPLLGRSQLGACYFSGRKYNKAIRWSWKDENTQTGRAAWGRGCGRWDCSQLCSPVESAPEEIIFTRLKREKIYKECKFSGAPEIKNKTKQKPISKQLSKHISKILPLSLSYYTTLSGTKDAHYNLLFDKYPPHPPHLVEGDSPGNTGLCRVTYLKQWIINTGESARAVNSLVGLPWPHSVEWSYPAEPGHHQSNYGWWQPCGAASHWVLRYLFLDNVSLCPSPLLK